MYKWLFILSALLLSGCADDNRKEQFDIANATALDKKTDLMWATTDNQEDLNWQEAIDYCNTYSGGGFQDWRMPTTEELQALIESQIGRDGEVIRLTGNLVWSSNTEDSKGAFCNFKERTCFWMEQVISISLRALPVRNTKASPAAAPLPSSDPIATPQTLEQRLQVLSILYKQKLITQDEYNRKKAAVLDEL